MRYFLTEVSEKEEKYQKPRENEEKSPHAEQVISETK